MCKMRSMQACECQIRLSPSVNWVEMRFAAARTAVAVSSGVADGSTFLMYGTVSAAAAAPPRITGAERSEEHTSELQSLMRISYAVFCLKKKSTTKQINIQRR